MTERVVITGASSGIGEATAYRFARAGAHLALLARREERLSRVKAQVHNAGGVAHVIPVDLEDDAKTRRAIARAEAALGGRHRRFGEQRRLRSVRASRVGAPR